MSDLSSHDLAARLTRNPHNLSGPDRMSAHDYWAARFEAEGRAAFHNSTGGNPYNPDTMAADRWATGFMNALAEHRSNNSEV